MSPDLDELPEGWAHKTIGQITTLITKGSTPTSYGYKFQSSGINFLKIENIVDGEVTSQSITSFISEDAHEYLKRSQLKENDLLFSIAGSIGTSAIVDSAILPANTNQALALIRGYEEYATPSFLLYSLRSEVLNETKSKSRGGALQNISLTDIKNTKIPLPPLSEQKRIVTMLDALFTRIDTAIIHLQQTLELSKALFASAYNETFDKIDTPEVELGSVADFFNGFAFKGKELIEEGVPVLRISNIQKGGISFSRMAYFPEQHVTQDIQRFYVEPNDIVIAMSGATTGKVAINDSGMRLLQNQRVGRFVIHNEYTRKFVYQFLSIKVEQNLQQAMGAAQPNLSTKQIKEIKIPLPSLNEQKQVVKHLDALAERTCTLESVTHEKINHLTALKASLLDAAFKGKL